MQPPLAYQIFPCILVVNGILLRSACAEATSRSFSSRSIRNREAGGGPLANRVTNSFGYVLRVATARPDRTAQRSVRPRAIVHDLVYVEGVARNVLDRFAAKNEPDGDSAPRGSCARHTVTLGSPL
jgi:hypothetical protein